MVTVLLNFFGISASPTTNAIVFHSKANVIGKSIIISWNCIGWQSLILLLITLITGLQGPYYWGSKLHTIIIGVLGTFWVNIMRITVVVLIAQYVNTMWAMIFHDYFSTFITVIWLLFFWWFAYAFVLIRERNS